MRASLLVMTMLAATSGCLCSPATPQPVTLRVVNTTRAPIYVDTSTGKLGLTIKRDVGGSLFGFDDLACECRYCSNACNRSCTCPDAGVGKILKIEPGGTAERSWNGVVQVSGSSGCSTEGCLDQQNAPLNETFNLELCFSAQRPTGVVFNDAGIGQGQLPVVSTTCGKRTFAPQDLEVEISPAKGSSCTTTADCKGLEELCFDGACTSGCPANDFPPLGGEWILAIASPDNMGFFDRTARSGEGSQLFGTGTLTSATYQSSTLLMSFSRTVSGETLTGRVQIKLPTGTGVPLVAGRQVRALVVDDGATPPSRAFVLRDAMTQDVLLAADMAQGSRTLTDADLAPFQVTSATAPVGCQQDACGRLLYYPRHFATASAAIDLLPGEHGELAIGTSRWSFLNVSSGAYAMTPCQVSDLRPYVLWKNAPP